MKSLDQLEARTIVTANNTPGDPTNTFIIRTPGSYYLTGNITGAFGKHGISVQADDVTLDLNGFALVSGGGGAFRGVDIPAVQKNFCIRNGTVRGWTDGGVRTDLATSTLAEKLRLSDNVGATGLFLGNGSARDCVATGNGTGFVVGNGAEIRDCAAAGNVTGFSAADRTMLSNCISTVNTGDGFNCTSFVTLTECTSGRNGGSGIIVQGSCTVMRCNASKNIPSGYGIFAGDGCTIADCTAGANGIDGIRASNRCLVTRNTCDSNTSAGIQIGFASNFGNRVDGNSCTANQYGFLAGGDHNLVIRNSARGNSQNNFRLAFDDASGPIVDMTAGGQIVSTSPWANFSY
jgi:hypothetical protein